MFVYLSKKIAIPNNIKLNCISWNTEEGYIAVGGTEGLLKILKLEQASDGQNRKGLAGVSNLSINQNLEGHKGSVKVVVWNNAKQKLTSADENGVILVWMQYKGSWYEEMTNDRKKSTIKDMHWSSDGTKICIVYEDGGIIVGSDDGNRLWGKELKNTHLTGVQWSPDNSLLLFSLSNGECHLYDNQGNFVMKLLLECDNLHLVGQAIHTMIICWYSGRISEKRPVLFVCYQSGKGQLMINENDQSPILLDCKMRVTDAKWNHDGAAIAICGNSLNTSNTKDCNQVQFYSPWGYLYRILNVPGTDITSISWEQRSLRIAMAIDSYIYFANVRPTYLWSYFEKTVVFVGHHNSSNKMTSVTFWNISTNQTFIKEIESCLAIVGCNEHCVLAVECRENLNANSANAKVYQLLVCNSIGTTIDSKYIEIRPWFVAINSNYVVICSQEEILLWHYHTSKSASQLHNIKARKCKTFHIDDIPTGVDLSKDLLTSTNITLTSMEKKDAICAMGISEKILLVARLSGIINEYTVSNVALRNRYKFYSHITKIAINCNSTRAAIINHAGVMTILELEDNRKTQLNLNQKVERKDVWSICWAKDNPILLALMEKTRLYIFRGTDPEEPIACSGYLCTFENLEVTGVLLDDIISGEETPNFLNHILQLKIKSLRDTADLLEHVGLDDAKQFIEENPHPRLWKLLAEAALKKLKLETAEYAFVRSADYQGIQLIKRLRGMPKESLRKAEVAAFYGEYDTAEKLYTDADRRDLAVNLRITLCDWFRVVQLYRIGSNMSDQQMETAWREIGHHFYYLRSWESAKEYYEKCDSIEGLMDSLYHLEQFDELANCVHKLPEKSPLLMKLAEMLTSVGMCTEAVDAYLKLGDSNSAVNACINLRQWGRALEVAKDSGISEVNTLFNEQIDQLLSTGHLMEVIEMQRQVAQYLEAAKVLIKLAESEMRKGSSFLRLKKLYVIAGVLGQQHLKNLNATSTDDSLSHQRTGNIALDGNINLEDSFTVETIWHYAEGYHFMLLAQRQLRSGQIHQAVATALRLCEYEDVLNSEDIYSLLALISFADKSYDTCLRALNKLISLEDLSSFTTRQLYEDLTANISVKYESTDSETNLVVCYACNSEISDSFSVCSNCGTHFPACILTGKAITQPSGKVWICSTCNHCIGPMESITQSSCPLCHSVITPIQS